MPGKELDHCSHLPANDKILREANVSHLHSASTQVIYVHFPLSPNKNVLRCVAEFFSRGYIRGDTFHMSNHKDI